MIAENFGARRALRKEIVKGKVKRNLPPLPVIPMIEAFVFQNCHISVIFEAMLPLNHLLN